MPGWHVELERCFFINFLRKNELSGQAACVEGIANIMFFIRLHVYRKGKFPVSRGGFLESSWVLFGALGVDFCSLPGYPSVVENYLKFLGSSGRAPFETRPTGKVTHWSRVHIIAILRLVGCRKEGRRMQEGRMQDVMGNARIQRCRMSCSMQIQGGILDSLVFPSGGPADILVSTRAYACSE